MRDWRGAVTVSSGSGWAIVLLAVTQQPNGRWRYLYSIKPGVVVSWVTGGGSDIVSPYDNAIISSVRAIAGGLPAART